MLAAGRSRRFGSDKLLHPVCHDGKDKPLILHSIAPWLAVFPRLDVVIREDNHALLTLLNSCEYTDHLRLIPATDADQGMSVSLRCGIQASREAAGWLIGLADMPYISASVIKQSLQTLQGGAMITQAEYQGRRGHPVGFSAAFLLDLLTLKGDKGARDILAASRSLVIPVPSPDNGIFHDIDCQENILR